jgi:hypothetical protein
MNSINRLVTGHSSMTEELPLIHTSRCEYLTSIISTGILEPRPCEVFKESLLYLFYGRPAYRSIKGTKSGEPIVLCPVCFVFKPRTVSRSLYRIYPCDSGAVAHDRLAPEITAADLKGLALDPQIENARRMVSLLFEHNSDYFVGKVVSGKSFDTGTLEARFYSLLQRPGPVDFDDRKSAIEVQVDHGIPLAEQLLFVVLPKEFLEENAVRNAIINVWNCDPLAYPTFHGDAPAVYYSVVRQKVLERFQEATRI